MNRTGRDVTRIVESWLEDGVSQLPDRVLDEVERQLPATHQRRAGWLARRFHIMNNSTIRYGLAVAAIVVVALLGIRFLPGGGNTGGPPPTPTPTVQPTPTAEPTPALPALGAQETLAAGRYIVGTLPFDVTVEVPAGWGSGDDWIVVGPHGAGEPRGMAIRFFTDGYLFEDPAMEAGPLIEVGPTVNDMVDAIVEHPGWDASDPTEITIDGRGGQMVALTIPADAEMSADDQFFIFSNGQGGHVWGWATGQTFDLYIVDVDGERLIIDAWHYADTPAEDLAAQRAVVQSIQFDLRP